MAEKKKLVVLITRGLDDERSSVAWSVANGGINSGLDVSIFLTSSAVEVPVATMVTVDIELRE